MFIGISGKKKSGKDTVADIISTILPNCIKYSFATELKKEVSRATGFSVKYIDEHKDNFRLVLQGWGTDFRRGIYGDTYWIKKMEEACEQFGMYENILIPDVRFENEYDWIKSKNGIVIRVDRHMDFSDSHISETALDNYKFDHHIINDGTLEDLVVMVEQLNLCKTKE